MPPFKNAFLSRSSFVALLILAQAVTGFAADRLWEHEPKLAPMSNRVAVGYRLVTDCDLSAGPFLEFVEDKWIYDFEDSPSVQFLPEEGRNFYLQKKCHLLSNAKSLGTNKSATATHENVTHQIYRIYPQPKNYSDILFPTQAEALRVKNEQIQKEGKQFSLLDIATIYQNTQATQASPAGKQYTLAELSAQVEAQLAEIESSKGRQNPFHEGKGSPTPDEVKILIDHYGAKLISVKGNSHHQADPNEITIVQFTPSFHRVIVCNGTSGALLENDEVRTPFNVEQYRSDQVGLYWEFNRKTGQSLRSYDEQTSVGWLKNRVEHFGTSVFRWSCGAQ